MNHVLCTGLTANVPFLGTTTPEQEIRDIEQQISRAVVAGDADFMDRLWAKNYVYTGPRGERKSKAELIDDMQSGKLKFEVLRFADIQVRMHGDFAWVTGTATAKGHNANGEVNGEVRYLRIYQCVQGCWQLLVFQATPVVKK